MPPVTTKRKDIWIHSVLLIVAIVFAYSKVFKAGFMNWDDLDYVFNIKDLNTGISTDNIKHWFTRNYLGNYQPLPVLTYAIDHSINGPDPFVYHLHSILWHMAATLLLYIFIRRLHENLWVAFFVALLFAIHPVQTESVSWIAARNKSMNAVFYFASMCYYLSYLRDNNKRKLIWVTFFGLLAYLCKATALALPLALFAVDIWLNRSLKEKKIWLEKIPLILVGIPVAIITLLAQKEVTFLQHHSGFGWSNIVYAGYALVQYASHLIFPVKLSVLYPYPNAVSLEHILFLIPAAIIVVLMIILYRKGYNIWAGGILFFIVNLLPVLQLVQFGETLMADRYLYIACVGLWFPLMHHLFFYFKNRSFKISLGIATCLCLVFFTLTFFRNTIWLNEINFWNSVLKKFPASTVAHYSIGAAYIKENDLENAEIHMNKAVYYEPSSYKAWRNKGSLHLRQGKTSLAMNALNKSLALYPYSKAYFTRALLYHQLKKYPETISDLNKVIEQEPDNARAYYILADCQEQLNQNVEAMNNYNKAISYDAREPLFLIKRGLLFAKMGKKQEAYTDLDKAIALRPGNGEAYYYRAMMHYSLGESPCNDLQLAQANGYTQAREVITKICR